MAALDIYIAGCQALGVNLTTGYLFRIVTDTGCVLDQPVTYSVVYERLRSYLLCLGIYEGETPHSFRSGCAITIALSNSNNSRTTDVMGHVGWFTEQSADYYSRSKIFNDAQVATKLADACTSKDAEDNFNKKVDYSQFKTAF